MAKKKPPLNYTHYTMRANTSRDNIGHVFQNLSVAHYVETKEFIKRIFNPVYSASYFWCIPNNGASCLFCWPIESKLNLTFSAVIFNMKASSASAVTHANAIITGAHSAQWQGVRDGPCWFI